MGKVQGPGAEMGISCLLRPTTEKEQDFTQGTKSHAYRAKQATKERGERGVAKLKGAVEIVAS